VTEEKRGIDRVEVALESETVVIPWTSQQALLERLRPNESTRGVVDAFEAVGTSRPVRLRADEKDALREAIRLWAEENGGYDGLPEGIAELRIALVDDGHG
jgi:hypothetical protein